MTILMKSMMGAALLAISLAAHADTIVINGSFEANNIGNSPWRQLSAVTGWTSSATGNAAFEIQKGVTQGGLSGFNQTAFDGIQYLELNTHQFTSISQTLATTQGDSYTLSFAYSGRPNTANQAESAIKVYWGGQEVLSTTATASSGWKTYSIKNLTSLGNATELRFSSIGPSSSVSYGSYLDGVQVSRVLATSPVPEPSTYGMMIAGLGLLSFMARRRRVK
jgi:hypothetical protein